jgi:hypothetical protein
VPHDRAIFLLNFFDELRRRAPSSANQPTLTLLAYRRASVVSEAERDGHKGGGNVVAQDVVVSGFGGELPSGVGKSNRESDAAIYAPGARSVRDAVHGYVPVGAAGESLPVVYGLTTGERRQDEPSTQTGVSIIPATAGKQEKAEWGLTNAVDVKAVFPS